MLITILWFLGCLALGLAYAFVLYNRRSPLNKTLRNSLFILRTISVAVISFLLFAPAIKTTTSTSEKPLIILAQDNSASIAISEPKSFNSKSYSEAFRQLEKELSEDFDVRSYHFGPAVNAGLNFRFDEKSSNFSSVFEMIKSDFANRNIGAIILASDGIYNQGGNPVFAGEDLNAAIYTVALGDTIARKDLLIANVNYNNIVYLDNQFQIEVSIEAFESAGSNTRMTVSDQSGTVFTRSISINSNEFRINVPVTLSAKRKGIQRYTINLSALDNELSLQNNSQTIFLEVIDGRQNVLILGNAPHPDLAAFRQSIEINKNYEVELAFADVVTPAQIQKAGLVIMHQLPSISNGAQKIIEQISNKPILFVLGAQSNINAFSASQDLLTLNSSGSNQEATPRVQTDFYGFILSEYAKTRIPTFGPLTTPFGNYGLKGPATVALVQQIGRVQTDKPLLVFGGDENRKIGVLAGEGIWRWRLEEFQETNAHEAVNEIIGKTVQFLSSRDDKRKFRVYASKNAFGENDRIILNAELYNDAYELVNTPDVNATVRDSAGKNYSFLFSRTGSSYLLDAGILPPGAYSYTAKTRLGSQDHQASGQFVIRPEQIEFQQTRANHQLLYALAEQSGGQMIYPQQLNTLSKLIHENENVKTVVYEDRKYEDAVNYKIVFFLIICLLGAEWFWRKRNGEV